jgi:hypothetical protein
MFLEKMKAMGSGRVLVEIFPPSDEWKMVKTGEREMRIANCHNVMFV